MKMRKLFVLWIAILCFGFTSYASTSWEHLLQEIPPAPYTEQNNFVDVYMLGFFNFNNGADHDKFWQQGLSFCACYDTEIYLKTASGQLDTIPVMAGNNLLLNPLSEYAPYTSVIQLATASDDVNVIYLDQPILDVNNSATTLCYDEDGPGGDEPQRFFVGDPNLTSAAYGVTSVASQDTTGTFDQDTIITNSGFEYHPADSTTVIDFNTAAQIFSTLATGICYPCIALPLDIVNWEVNTGCSGNTISWDAIDADAAVFHIQYSTDGIDYETVGLVPHHEGDEFFHEIRSDVTHYYRIAAYRPGGSNLQTDWKSGIQNCSFQDADRPTLEVWGTRNNGQTVFVTGFTANEELNAEVYNLAGQKLLSRVFTPEEGLNIVFDNEQLTQLPSNAYYSIIIRGKKDMLSAKLLR